MRSPDGAQRNPGFRGSTYSPVPGFRYAPSGLQKQKGRPKRPPFSYSSISADQFGFADGLSAAGLSPEALFSFAGLSAGLLVSCAAFTSGWVTAAFDVTLIP